MAYSHVIKLTLVSWSKFIMDKFVFKRRRTEEQMAVAGVLDKTTDTPLTPAGEDDHSGPASPMCQARPDKDEQEEEEMEQQEEEDEERG